MLTKREKEIVASFKPWAKACGRDDFAGMMAAERAWYRADTAPIEYKPTEADLRNNEMAALYRDGKATVHELSARYNLTPMTVASYLTGRGLKVPFILAESV